MLNRLPDYLFYSAKINASKNRFDRKKNKWSIFVDKLEDVMTRRLEDLPRNNLEVGFSILFKEVIEARIPQIVEQVERELSVESWLTNIVCLVGVWAWIVWLCLNWTSESWLLLFSLYVCYMALEIMQALVILYYSERPGHDALVCLVVPLVPVYQLFLMVVRTWALIREIVLRSSFEDNYVPRHVREATWRW